MQSMGHQSGVSDAWDLDTLSANVQPLVRACGQRSSNRSSSRTEAIPSVMETIR